VIYLNDIISALTDHEIPSLDVRISDVVIDSRQAVEGSLFIALPGERVDGHHYLQAAFDNGAILALIDQEVEPDLHILDLRPGYFDPGDLKPSLPLCLKVDDTLLALQTIAEYQRMKHPLRTIGITGSVGKTSTKELTASLLSQKFSVLKNPGNRNNEIGLPLTLLELETHHQYAVLEMGFYVPGEIQTLCDIALPHIGVVTNIGTVHAERAGSQEIIAKGKAELVESLPPEPNGVAILNFDDHWVRWMAGKTRARTFSYGIIEEADLTASEITTHGLEGVSCTLNYKDHSHQISSPLLGEFSVYTILAATAVSLAEGLDWETIKTGLRKSHFDLRLHHFTLDNEITVLDDSYNASPESTIAALKLLSGLKGRRVAILGDMLELGPYEHSEHYSVGTFTVSAADVLILVGDRSKTIRDAAIEKGFSTDDIHWFPDSYQAAKTITCIIENGDVVLIKGSNSMRMDRIIIALKELASC